MTRLELVKFIGDVLTQLDILIGSMSPSNKQRKPFIDARKALDKMQLKLSKKIFDDNTEEYKEAASELEAVNKKLQETITDLDNLVKTLENVNRFIGAVDKIIQTVFP